MNITRRFFLKGLACTSLVPLSLADDKLKIEQILDKMFIGIDYLDRPSSSVAYRTSFRNGKMVIDWISAEELYRQS